MKHDPFLSRFELMMDRALPRGNVEVHGTASSMSLALLLTQATAHNLRDFPNLVVTASQEDAIALQQNILFFSPTKKTLLLPSFDVSPYSGFAPSKKTIAQRMQWLYFAQHDPLSYIFIASIDGLLQNTLPKELLPQRIFKKGQDLPSDLNLLLVALGYSPAPAVEDVGTFAARGGILDIFSTAHDFPIRIELFGDTIESIRYFDLESQRSALEISEFHIAPAREVLFSDICKENLLKNLRLFENISDDETQTIKHSIFSNQYFQGIDFLIPFCYGDQTQVTDFFSGPTNVWFLNQLEIVQAADSLHARLKEESESWSGFAPPIDQLYLKYEDLLFPESSRKVHLTNVLIESDNSSQEEFEKVHYPTAQVKNIFNDLHAGHIPEEIKTFVEKLREENFVLFVSARTKSQAKRIAFLLERAGLHPQVVEESAARWSQWINDQQSNSAQVHIVPRMACQSIKLIEDQVVFLREDDFFDKKSRRVFHSSTNQTSQVKALTFGDLKPGDYIVHVLHGIGVYEGLTLIDVQGVPAEFIQLRYRDNDKLYLPVYRISQIQRYSSPLASVNPDKLGGTAWKKATIKVRSNLREVAAELLKIYAERARTVREPLPPPDEDFRAFEAFFPYAETDDQLRAIDDILKDLQNPKPMDRLICGDVGFGKTEVAMRAAFKMVQSGKQVAVLVPTTTLVIQHIETFKKRFKKWPINIGSFSRFSSAADSKKTLIGLKEGGVDIVIGTHRLFSRDISFKNLGLLIVDEEQKFGVAHKEKIRRIKAGVDTLALSATPIPRTLNMSLMGIRDLSIINTPPQDRLPTRTFVIRNSAEVIKKAIETELARGGQVLFLHNRVQSIASLRDELSAIVPKAKIRIGHGQMNEKELEDTILGFFKNDFDVLLCTTIIESGMDIPRANTMLIDRADTFGLSQLYQLRGRVGRSQERAYCYLLIPPNLNIDAQAQERLKILQENTALGSGIKVAHYDMELRGTGDLLGEDQSGHINAVGYDLYLELLEEALSDVRGDGPRAESVDPEINLRIPAFIPDSYIPDIRIRLAFYKLLSDTKTPDEIDRYEDDMRDRFGELPESVLNLFGITLIRQVCQQLFIKDASVGTKNLTLTFLEKTPLSTDKFIKLATLPDKKYKLSPNNRLIVKLEKTDWVQVHGELQYLKSLI